MSSNQPLATIAVAAENALAALRRPTPDIDDACARLARIAAQADRAGDIIDHLRAFTRAECSHGAGPGSGDRTSLAAAVNGALAQIETLLGTAGIAVSIDIPPDLPPVRGREVAIEHILVNLCRNAHDAIRNAPPGPHRLELRARRANYGVLLEVADTGGGIAEQILPRIFEPFFTTKPPGHGTGLGLALCQGMLRALGGSIAARNSDQGAVFTLRLPLAP